MKCKLYGHAFIACILALGESASAQDRLPDRPASSVVVGDVVPIGSPVLGTADLSTQVRLITPATARTDPPHGPFNLFVGDRLFDLKQGDVVNVVGRKSYGGFTGAQIWLEVAKRSADGKVSKTTAWIPAGTLSRESVLPDRVESVKGTISKAEK